MAATSLGATPNRPNLAQSNATNVSGPGSNLFGVYDSPTMLPRTPLAPGESQKNIMTTSHTTTIIISWGQTSIKELKFEPVSELQKRIYKGWKVISLTYTWFISTVIVEQNFQVSKEQDLQWTNFTLIRKPTFIRAASKSVLNAFQLVFCIIRLVNRLVAAVYILALFRIVF